MVIISACILNPWFMSYALVMGIASAMLTHATSYCIDDREIHYHLNQCHFTWDSTFLLEHLTVVSTLIVTPLTYFPLGILKKHSILCLWYYSLDLKLWLHYRVWCWLYNIYGMTFLNPYPPHISSFMLWFNILILFGLKPYTSSPICFYDANPPTR